MSQGKEYEALHRKSSRQDAWHLQRRREIRQEDEDRMSAQAKAKKEKTIQAKLEISQEGDEHEQQADLIAKKVVNDEDANVNQLSPASLTVQSKPENGAMQASDQLQAKLESSKGSGEAMDDATKGEMETKMGTDFSEVKIHTGAHASEMSESINAKAFTHGQDVYFKGGNYNPSSNEGKELLAHELTHTVQQVDGMVQSKIQRQENDPYASLISQNIAVPSLDIKQIEIVSLTGEIVYQGLPTSRNYHILTGVPDGVYLIRVTNSDGKKTVRKVLHYPEPRTDYATKISFVVEKEEVGMIDQRQSFQYKLDQRFKMIVERFDLDYFLDGFSFEELKDAEILLKQIEPFVLEGGGYRTSIMIDGSRYDAWNGIERLVLLDAPLDNKEQKHASAFDLTGKGLIFHYFRTDKTDESLNLYRSNMEGIGSHQSIPTLIVPQTSSSTSSDKNTKTQAPIVEQDNVVQPEGQKLPLAFNSMGWVVYDMPKPDVVGLASVGIDAFQLMFLYLDRGKSENYLGGGCRFEVRYKGIVMGNIDLQRGERGESENQLFRDAYSGKNETFRTQLKNGTAFRFCNSTTENFPTVGGDSDFIGILMIKGYPDCDHTGISTEDIAFGMYLEGISNAADYYAYKMMQKENTSQRGETEVEKQEKNRAVTIEEEGGTFFVNDTNGDQVASAYLDSNGYLNLKINTKYSATTGKMAFNKILEAINSHPDYGTIKGIKGLWQEGPMSDNLNTFNEKYFTEHWSEADAAKETFTGKMAKSAGYTEVEKVVIGSKDKNGKPTMVTTYFIKPQK